MTTEPGWLYREIVETCEQGVWLIDGEGRTTLVNPKLAEMLGCSRHELIGRSFFDFLDEEQTEVSRQRQARRRKGERQTYEHVFRRNDGSRLWVSVAASPIYGASGEFTGSLALLTDITERRRNELILWAQRSVFDLLARGEPVAAALVPLVRAVEDTIDRAKFVITLMEEGSGGPVPGAVAGSAPASDRALKLCHEVKMLSREGRALGVCSLYRDPPRSLTVSELAAVEIAKTAASLAIEHDRIRASLASAVSLSNAALDSTADGILIVDREGVMRGFNRKFAEMWRIPQEILDSRDDSRAIAYAVDQAVDKQRMLDRIQELYSRPEEESFDVIQLKDGRHFERYSIPQWLGDQVVGRVWSFRDVTASRIAERALRESEARFRKLTEASFEGLVIHENGVVLLANESAARIFGFELPELIGVKVTDLAAPEERERVLGLMRAGFEGVYEAKGIRKDGTVFWGELSSRETEFEGRRVRLAAMRDITDRKRFQEQLEKELVREHEARVAAEELSRYRTEMLAVASHELKTPLTPLRMYLQLIRDYVGGLALPASPKTGLFKEAIDQTEREYDRLVRLIDSTLEASRIAVGGVSLNRARCDLAGLVRDTAARFSQEFARVGCSLSLDITDGIAGDWDRPRLEQVLSNLITNALKFGAGRPISISVARNGNRARVSVRDQGIGISKEDQQRIFERFYRAVSIKNFAGMGLGLFVVREIVAAHGGTVSVESEPGRGSSFILELPL